MVAKIIALYKSPSDAEVFDEKFYDEHLPLAQQLPGLQLLEVSKVKSAPHGEAAYYLMEELYFDNLESCKSALSSAEGKAVEEHLKSFTGTEVTLMYAEVADKK